MTFDQLEAELDRLRGLPFPPADYQTHWLGLQGLPLDVLRLAVTAAARLCDRFPSPAELRTLADAHRPSMSPFDDREVVLTAPRVITARTTAAATSDTLTMPFIGKSIVVEREWRYYCDDCSDTGQFSLWCDRHEGSEVTRKPWMLVLRCEMHTCKFYPHEWVKPCACWFTNPALLRKREEQAKYAAQRSKDRKAS